MQGCGKVFMTQHSAMLTSISNNQLMYNAVAHGRLPTRSNNMSQAHKQFMLIMLSMPKSQLVPMMVCVHNHTAITIIT
eukprot:13868388-Ditylum_brightwellii.AAC.1